MDYVKIEVAPEDVQVTESLGMFARMRQSIFGQDQDSSPQKQKPE